MINSLLSFGAKSVNPEILEKTLSTRKEVVDSIEKSCVAKIKDGSTFQSLIIAPRGSGKTHVTKVLYHRFIKNPLLTNKAVIAYMSEDEVGIANFTDLMVSILRAFVRYGEKGSEIIEPKIVEASLISDVFKRESTIKSIVNDFVGKRIIILLIENFDKILISLDKLGQGSLRDFIHQYNNLSVIATSQNLISSLQDSKMPFYNFFNVHQLKKLNFEETTKFLISIAKSEGNNELAVNIVNPESKGKLRAIFELTEGNHRLLVTFFSFLKAEFKSELSDVFVKVMNDLKPYYEQFINALPPLQQKIVKHLALTRGASSGKEIARSCFIESNVFSKQMSLLADRGMIDKNKLGKDVFYELKEPLMRICFEIGENPNGISKLFVDFLSCYYNREIIHKQYLKFKYGARFQSKELKCKYENEALMYSMALNDSENDKVLKEHSFLNTINDPAELYRKIETIDIGNKKEENIEIGNRFFNEGNFDKAIENYKKAIELNTENEIVYYNLGISYNELKEYYKAIESFQQAIKLNPKFDKSYYNLGNTFGKIENNNSAIECFQKAIEINPKHDFAFNNLGVYYGKIKEFDKAIECYQMAIEINPKDELAFNNLGIVFFEIKQYYKAIESFQKSIKLNSNSDIAHYFLGKAFTEIRKYTKAIEIYQKAIKINPKNDYVFNNMGLLYLKTNQIEKAFNAFDRGLEINPNNLNTQFSLLGANIRINDFNKSKELLYDIITKAENELLIVALKDDILYNLFMFGSETFVNMYFEFLLKIIYKEGKQKQFWQTLPESLFEILINFEDYNQERLANIENTLTNVLSKYEESIIPIRLFSIGVAYLKNNEKSAIYKLSKEERKLFYEAILDKRETAKT